MGTYPKGWGTRRGELGGAATRGWLSGQKSAWQRLQQQGIVPSGQAWSYVPWLDPHQSAGQTISYRDLAGIETKGVFQRIAQPKKVGSQFGAHTAMHSPGGRGYPYWVMQMLGKGSELGKPPGESGDTSIGTLAGLAAAGYVIFKVLV